VPGTEVLANSLNTILRQRFYSETPEWFAIACAALVALIVLAGLSFAQGKHETLKQAGMIVLLAGLIIGLNYLAFARWLVFPPLGSCSVSLIAAVPLVLLRRSLVASRELDTQIQKMASAESRFWPSAEATKADPADLIARLTGAVGVTILSRMPSGRYELAANSGIPLVPSLKKMDELLLETPAGSDHQKIGSSTAATPDQQMGRFFTKSRTPGRNKWLHRDGYWERDHAPGSTCPSPSCRKKHTSREAANWRGARERLSHCNRIRSGSQGWSKRITTLGVMVADSTRTYLEDS